MQTTREPTRSILAASWLALFLVAFVVSTTSYGQEEKPRQTAASEEGKSPAPVKSAEPAPEKEGEPATPPAQTPTAPKNKNEIEKPLPGGPPDAPIFKPSARDESETTGPQPALGGYCPVAYHTLGTATKGKPEYQSTFIGGVYYFHSAEAKAKFDEDPGKYLPRLSGLCTTALGGTYGNRLWGDPTVFDIVDGKLYLFWNERAKRAYEKDPQTYIANATERFAEPAIGGYCPVAYQTRNRAIKCPPLLRTTYGGWTYYLSDVQAFETFQADPARYAPQYRGYCAEGVSRNKRFKADPTQFVVRDNKTYLFYDAKAKLEFRARSGQIIERADENWKTLKEKLPL